MGCDGAGLLLLLVVVVFGLLPPSAETKDETDETAEGTWDRPLLLLLLLKLAGEVAGPFSEKAPLLPPLFPAA